MVNVSEATVSSPSPGDSAINNTTVPQEHFDIIVLIPGSIFLLIDIIIVGGNLLVLMAVHRHPKLKKSVTTYFVINLAFSDLLLGLVVLPFSAILDILDSWPFGKILCIIWARLDVFCCTLSNLTLCVISVDRYIGVTRPLRYTVIMTRQKVILLIGIVWLCSVAMTVPPLFGWGTSAPPDPSNCHHNMDTGYVFFSAFGLFFLPSIIMSCLYLRIFQIVKRNLRAMKTGIKAAGSGSNDINLRIHRARPKRVRDTCEIKTNSSFISNASDDSGSDVSVVTDLSNSAAQVYAITATKTTEIDADVPASPSFYDNTKSKNEAVSSMRRRIACFKQENKAAITLGRVVGAFIVCWLPFFVYLPLDAATDVEFPDIVLEVTFWLGYVNSAINPFIYAYSSPEFRKAFMRILKCRHQRKVYH
ncbi:alpha-1A adrenergic receptor-like [Argopecten irradians]|uniref:alpha-1A adrenergic receptor-like n=1 Tax=Argopecten irradians TaxID=31199 RepID=UPI00371BF3A9